MEINFPAIALEKRLYSWLNSKTFVMKRLGFLVLLSFGLITTGRSQSVTLSGEPNLIPDQYSLITWPADSIHSDKLDIDVSTDDGESWDIVVAGYSISSSYEWMAPHHHQDDILRITDDAGDTLYSNPFSVREGDLIGVAVTNKLAAQLPFPNPTTSYINLPQSSGDIRIYNGTGQRFLCPVQSNEHSMVLDVRSLSVGEYWVESGGRLSKFTIFR